MTCIVYAFSKISFAQFRCVFLLISHYNYDKLKLWKVRAYERRPAPYFWRASPPASRHTNDRKEADNNVYYIFGFNSVWNIHCRSRRIVLYNLHEKKIAATTAIGAAGLIRD